jgi:hypothetical protein
VRGLSCSGDETSTQELVLAKALKPSRKFSSGSSGFSPVEMASGTKVGVGREKTPLSHTGVSGVGKALKALDLFGSASCAFEDETVVPMPAPMPHQKHPWKSPAPKIVRKSSDASPAKGTSARRCFICLFYVRYI